MWATGIFEGEGCLTYHSTQNRWVFKVKMTDKDVVDKTSKIFKIHYRGPYKHKSKRKDGGELKDYWVMETARRDLIYQIICDIYPYLGARRRKKCNEFLQWYAAKTNKRYD